MAKPITQATFKKSDKVKIVAQFSTYKDVESLDVRQFVVKGEELIPTAAGVKFPTDVENLDLALKFFNRVVRIIEYRISESTAE